LGQQTLIDSTFAHEWEAEVLASRPLILPSRQFVYPVQVEEVEHGALEIMIRPARSAPFLATCALGFAGSAVPSGVWACPDAAWICAVAGGYAYLIDTREMGTGGVPARNSSRYGCGAKSAHLFELSFAACLGAGREGLANRAAELGRNPHYINSKRNAAGIRMGLENRSGTPV
jgi:hypothetical protein